MLKWRFTIPALVVIIFVAMYVFMFNGYRFSAQSAARSNTFITKNYHLFASYASGPFGIFLFKSDVNRMYRTVLSERSGPLYRSSVSVYIPYQSGALQTVGDMNYSSPDNGFTFMSFKSNNNNVAYIEAGVQPNRERKEIKEGQTISFWFDHYVSRPDIEAFDAQGKELYYYGYPKNTSEFSSNNFSWHKFQSAG